MKALRSANRLYPILATVFFLTISLPLVYLSRGERSPYVQTFANFPAGQFGLFGGNYILDDGPFFSENELYISQILMFNGSADHVAMNAFGVRAMYSFVASLWAPLLGVIGSQQFVNFLGWALAAWVAWRFTLKLFEDQRAALIAVLLVGGGLGFVLHSNDYSPHLVPFAVYYLGILMVYETLVWRECRPLRIHLLLGLCLALACLTYTMEVALVIAYVAVAIRRNRWWHVTAAAVIALSSRFVYTIGLNADMFVITRKWQWLSPEGIESDYLHRSLAIWAALLPHPTEFIARVLNGLAQFSFFEFPLIIVLGLVSWLFLPRSWALWRFFVAFFILPIAAGMAYLNFSTTRGYLVYGISLLIYAPLAGLLARGLRSASRAMQFVAAAVAVVVVGMQWAWSTAFLWGYILPAKTFFGFGYLEWIPIYLRQFVPPPALSLTGAEPAPLMFGGHATLRDAGLLVATTHTPVHYSVLFALVARLVIVAYASLLVLVIARSRRSLAAGLAAVFIGIGLVPVGLAQALPPQKPAELSTFYTTAIPPETRFRYTVTVSDQFIRELTRYEHSPVTVQFMTCGIHAPFEVRVTGGRDTVFAESQQGGMFQNAVVGLPEMLAALKNSPELNLYITTFDKVRGNPIGTTVFGWQRNGLPHRSIWNESTHAAWESTMLPALEFHVLDAAGRSVLIGF
jgi:hypothetical protein